MNTDTPGHQAPTPMQIVNRLRTLAEPLDQTGRLVRWDEALAKAARTDGDNPAMADIMDLVLLSIEDVTDPAARVSRAEVHMRGKTVARFNFPIIQLALIAKVGQALAPDGSAGLETVTAEDMRDRMLAVFLHYGQGFVLDMTVADYEAKLTAAGMIPEKAEGLSRLVVSVLAGAREDGHIDYTKPLNQFMYGDKGDTPSCAVVGREAPDA